MSTTFLKYFFLFRIFKKGKASQRRGKLAAPLQVAFIFHSIATMCQLNAPCICFLRWHIQSEARPFNALRLEAEIESAK
jgi:hypothetical protein